MLAFGLLKKIWRHFRWLLGAQKRNIWMEIDGFAHETDTTRLSARRSNVNTRIFYSHFGNMIFILLSSSIDHFSNSFSVLEHGIFNILCTNVLLRTTENRERRRGGGVRERRGYMYKHHFLSFFFMGKQLPSSILKH